MSSSPRGLLGPSQAAERAPVAPRTNPRVQQRAERQRNETRGSVDTVMQREANRRQERGLWGPKKERSSDADGFGNPDENSKSQAPRTKENSLEVAHMQQEINGKPDLIPPGKLSDQQLLNNIHTCLRGLRNEIKGQTILGYVLLPPVPVVNRCLRFVGNAAAERAMSVLKEQLVLNLGELRRRHSADEVISALGPQMQEILERDIDPEASQWFHIPFSQVYRMIKRRKQLPAIGQLEEKLTQAQKQLADKGKIAKDATLEEDDTLFQFGRHEIWEGFKDNMRQVPARFKESCKKMGAWISTKWNGFWKKKEKVANADPVDQQSDFDRNKKPKAVAAVDGEDSKDQKVAKPVTPRRSRRIAPERKMALVA